MAQVYVYAISSLEHNYVSVGLTGDIKERLNRHNSGYEKTTKFYAPFKLIHSEIFNNRPDARTREKYLKSGAGKRYLKVSL